MRKWAVLILTFTQVACVHQPIRQRATFRGEAGSQIQVFADRARTEAEVIENVGRLAIKAERHLRDVFRISGPSTYQIYVAASTSDFDELAGTRTDWAKNGWIVGLRRRDGAHILRDPRTWDEASHQFVKLDELITHEMAHSFTTALSAGPRARARDQATLGQWTWLEEGMASYAAGQHLTWRHRAKFNFANQPHFRQITEYGNYTTAASALEYLITTYPKEKLFEVFRRLPGDVDVILAAVYAPVTLDELERGWKAFALKTYQTASP